jgi:glycosyltransferase involved in cell wall biosynthesis
VEKIKIAFLSTFYPYRGGIAQFNARLYKQLTTKHEIKAFTFTRQFPNLLFPGKSQYISKEDKAEIINSERILDSINPISYIKSAKRIQEYCPDLLLLRFWMPFFAPSFGMVASKLRKNGIKVIAILDNVIPHEQRFFDIVFIKYFLKRIDGFIVMSETVKKDLISIKPDSKFILKPHPLYDHFDESINSMEARRQLGLPENKKLLLYFGFIRDYKGLDTLLVSMRYLPDEYHLVIAGEIYGDFGKYQKLIDNYKINNKISLFIRYINDPEVPTFFSAADVCILPYKSATQSGIVQVAYNYNLPVIASNVGGLSEIIDHQKNGFLVEPNRPNILAGVIEEYFTKGLYERFSKNIKEKKVKYSWSVFSDSLIEFYKTLLNQDDIRVTNLFNKIELL